MKNNCVRIIKPQLKHYGTEVESVTDQWSPTDLSERNTSTCMNLKYDKKDWIDYPINGLGQLNNHEEKNTIVVSTSNLIPQRIPD